MMFRDFIDPQIDRVRRCPQAGMLGEKVYKELESALKQTTNRIAGSTVMHMVSQAAADNPFAAAFPALLTEEEKNRALAEVRRRHESGAVKLPDPLVGQLSRQLESQTDAFLEALVRMAENRDAICAALTGGRLYRTIENITLSAGDTHNQGRSVTIFHTDAGKLVYKPHDLRVDEALFLFAERFFSEFVGIPRSIAFGDRFGVCEFIEKRRAEGEAEAERFWYCLGGLTAFAKLLGSTDLHYQNLLCCGTKPYIIDLETVLSPVFSGQAAHDRPAETKTEWIRSPAASLVMPRRVNDIEVSVLMNTQDDGIAPVVDGRIVTVRSYLPVFKTGYRAAYARAAEQKKEIEEAVRSFFPDMAVRVLLRSTRGYFEILGKLYHHTALVSEESRQRNRETLRLLLRDSGRTLDDRLIDSEVRQLQRGDVPYFYTRAGSRSLFADGEELVREWYGLSPIGHVLNTLRAMDEKDELFDISYIDRAVMQYPETPKTHRRRESVPPEEKGAPLSAEAAAREAERIFGEMFALRLPAPDGRSLWGFVGNSNHSLLFSDHSLFDGLTGLAVFASACAAVCPEASIREKAEALSREAADEVRSMCRRLEAGGDLQNGTLPVGEGSGLGGILTGVALIKRTCPGGMAEPLQKELLSLLEKADFSGCTEPDRITGLAGLVSALCRFEEYRGCHAVIRAAADRLLELRSFVYRDAVLWKTMHNVPRALSGAGHGMAGIAEALISASDVLADDRYLPAAAGALDYERRVYEWYSERFGTWADLRDMPPGKYMHGYCSGAPGIGVMLSRIREKRDSGQARTLANLVRDSVDRLPLNDYDHLCCGNAAIAEYYLTAGDREAAGRVLGTIYARRQANGCYRDSYSNGAGSVTASLFNGISGIGYEMLRFAFPDRIPSLL